MAANSNLVLQLLITAKDDASAAFSKLFGYLDDNTKVIAGKIREAFTGLFGGGLESAADLEAAFDAVAAKGGYTAEEMTKLKQEAAAVAAQFGVTGQESAQGLEILAAAGLNAKDAVATLPQVLALAKSEGVSLEVAAERLADSLAIMGLGFEEAGRMADVLAKGANLSTVSATQLAESLSTVGGIAKAAGMSLEETVAALDLLAKNGIKGERAGTALQAVLTALQNPASTASQALTALGITSRDLGTVLDGLQGAGAGSETAILAFGETAGPALRALIGEGSVGLEAFTAQLENAEGAAQAAADGMSGNLNSALSSMNAALDTLKQTLVEPLLEPLAKAARALSEALTEAVQSGAFSGLTDAIKIMATAASEAAEKLVKAFDFKAIGASITTLVTGGMSALSQAMNNVGAIAGALAVGAIIPLVAAMRTAVVSTQAWVAAKTALAASMTAAEIATVGFSKVLAVLAGPAGWILAAVTALALLWKEEDKTKAATDALSVATDEYTKILKEQTAAQNQVALNKLNDALDEQRQKLAEAKVAYDQAAQSERSFIVVTEDHGGVLGKTTRVISDATEIERLRQERLAEVDRQTQLLNATEERRKIIIDELKAKQDAANPATAAAEAALGKYRIAVDDATAAQTQAREALDKLTPGTTDYGIAAGKAALADEQLKQAKEVLIKAESDYHQSIQESIRGLAQNNDATLVALNYQKDLYAAAEKRNALEQQIADAYVKSADSAVKSATAELALAKIKGDSNALAEASLKVAQAELTALQAKRIEQEKDLQNYQNIADRITDLTRRKSILGAADQAELKDLKEKNPAIAEVIAGRQQDIAATDAQIQAQQKEVNQAEKMAGPIGELIRLYEKKTQTLSRETAEIERGYSGKIRDLQVEKDQADAKGDTVRAGELAIEIKQAEADQAQASADAMREELGAQIDLIEAKKLAMGIEERATEAGREKLAQMDEQIAKMRDLIDAEQDKADSAKASADSAESSAKKAGDAAEKSGEQAEKASKGFTLFSRSWFELTEAGNAFVDSIDSQAKLFTSLNVQGIGKLYNGLYEALTRDAEAGAALTQKIKELETALSGTGGQAELAQRQLIAMATSGSTGIEGLTQAGEQARQKLEEIRNAALDAETALSEMAQDFNKQILQLQGNQKALLELEQQERLAQLDELYAKSGQLGTEEYNTAKARANELHRLKIEQLNKENASTQDTAIQTANAVRSAWKGVGDEVDIVNQKAKGMDFSGAVNQSAALKQNFTDLQSVL